VVAHVLFCFLTVIFDRIAASLYILSRDTLLRIQAISILASIPFQSLTKDCVSVWMCLFCLEGAASQNLRSGLSIWAAKLCVVRAEVSWEDLFSTCPRNSKVYKKSNANTKPSSTNSQKWDSNASPSTVSAAELLQVKVGQTSLNT